MKKRVKDSEIEAAKRKNIIIFIFTVLMLIVVLCGIIFFVCYERGLIKFSLKDSKETESFIGQNSNELSINKDNLDVLKLFDVVKISDNYCDGYNLKKKLNVSKMNSKCKFDLASNIYKKSAVFNNDGILYVSEDDVRYAYEYLYGYNTYEVQEQIPYNNSYLLYNSETRNYFLNSETNEIGTSLISYEKIVDILKKKNYLYITSSVVYYDKANKVLCRDYNCDSVIRGLNNEPNYPDYYDLYIDHNYSNLYKYEYKFKMDKNGFYKYVGFERTN